MFAKIRFYNKLGMYAERWVRAPAHFGSDKWSHNCVLFEAFCYGYNANTGCKAFIMQVVETLANGVEATNMKDLKVC